MNASPPTTATPLRGAVRGLRVASLGLASLLLACGAHVLGGGRLPTAATLAVTAVVLGLLAVVVTARRCRLPVLLGVLGVEQTALHYLFTAATAAGPLGCPADTHQHVGAVAAGCLRAGAPMAGMADASPAMSVSMLVGHALAVLATGWLLARGEAWLWELAARLVRATVVEVSALPVVVRLGTPVGPTPAAVTVPGALGSPRGPPTAPR